jgi:3-isopropylmalate/(R)-2-methylmalate dehydratase small subunit
LLFVSFVSLVSLVSLVSNVTGVLLTAAESLPMAISQISTFEIRIIGSTNGRKEQNIMGRIWMLGDNVNTDVIIPGRYNVTTDRTQLARYCLCEVLPEFAQQVRVGDVVMAGHNFGCGSSREHAPAALQACGVQVVIARSFARIFYRNAVNIGLPVLVCEEVVAASADGQDIELDLATGVIHNVTTGQAFQAEPLNPFVARIVAAGGIIEYIRQEGALR